MEVARPFLLQPGNEAITPLAGCTAYLLVSLVGRNVVVVTFGKELQEIGVRAEVKWTLVFLVPGIKVSSIGGEQDGNGRTAFLL